ncbi:MAG TPA: site-specific integrase [Streptosporangiaceae bacterium]|jgi:integrase
MASIIKRCDCGDDDWGDCPHPWVVRYRTEGGRSSKQREESFGGDRKEAEDFLLKIEHDKKAHVFIDPKAGQVTFREEAEAWLENHLGADSSISTYQSVLRTHVYPATGDRAIGKIRREDIKALIAAMKRKGLSASRIGTAHLVINAVFTEAVRNKKLSESPCTDIPVPDVVHAADVTLPAEPQLEALAAGLPEDWALTVWLMYGCGLRIGEALAIRTKCRVKRGTTLRVREQVNPVAELKPLKFRAEGEFRDVPLPLYVSEAMDKHIASHGTTGDGYLFQGRKHKLVIRRTYQEDFERAAGKAGLQPEFIPHSLRHCYASISLAHGIPITEVSRWLGHRSIEVTHQIYGHLVPTSWDCARTVLDDARRQPPDPEESQS